MTTAATHKRRLWRTTKAATSTTLLLVSIRGVDVYAILFHGWGYHGYMAKEASRKASGLHKAHVYLCECTLKCRANIERVQPFVAPLIRLNAAHVHADFRAKLRFRFLFKFVAI